ncbi:uncharacterized protein O3C94_022791 [Discoglossus pictus]
MQTENQITSVHFQILVPYLLRGRGSKKTACPHQVCPIKSHLFQYEGQNNFITIHHHREDPLAQQNSPETKENLLWMHQMGEPHRNIEEQIQAETVLKKTTLYLVTCHQKKVKPLMDHL